MPKKIRDLSRDWRPGDAARLARFINKTFEGWPGGGSDPRTPEEAERQVREHASLGVFVTEEEGEFRSFCSAYAKPTETKGAYVGLLTADPDFHGKGYGKAVLLAAVERVYQRGIARVDLHTWPGNMKAVPLYKKSGFMWSPESGQWGVYMQNFTPGARHNPIAQAFFRKHDWYATMKRDLSLTPDEHKRGKVRVYEYLWEEGGDRLRMVYDRRSWGLIEIETNDFLIGCSLPDEKLVAGIAQPVSWRIVNHGGEPLEVALIASADEGVSLDHRELLSVRRRAESRAEFIADPEIKEKEKEPRAQIIRTDVLVNGKPIRLEAGFEVVQAVHFSLDGDGMGLRPGRSEPVMIQCRSELATPSRVKLHLAASPGAELNLGTSSIELPARGAAQVPVQLTAAQAGAIELKVRSEVRAGGKLVKPKQAELHAHALGAGDVVGHVEKERVVLESAALRVHVSRCGGWTGVTDKLRNRWHVARLHGPQVGPPYAWDEFFETPCEARIEQDSGRVVAVLTTASIYRPGLVLEQRVALSSLPLIEVRSAIVNNTSAPFEGSIRQGAWFQIGTGKVSALVGGEVVEGVTGGASRHLAEHQLPDKGSEWAEGWFAATDEDGITAALLWDRAERVEWTELVRALPPAAPGESVSAGPMYVFVGEGGAFAVRRWWQLLFGERADREQRRPKAREPFEFGLSPRPLVAHGREAKAALTVDSVGRLELGGSLSLKMPPGLKCSPARVEFAGANQSRKVRRSATVSRGASAPEGAYQVEAIARIDRAIYHERQRVIALGDPGQRVTVKPLEKRSQFRISNGVLALTVAPGFMGSAISLERTAGARRGAPLLRSAYPDARPLSWMNPWTGGIQPGLGGLANMELFREGFTARPIARRGSQGIEWRGVRMTCSPKAEARREDTLSIDYLLAPGSAISAVCLRLTRRAGVAGWLEASFQLYPVLGGSHMAATITGEADGRADRVRCDYSGGVENSRWVIAENRKAGEAALLACGDREAAVGGNVWGRDGYCLTAGRSTTHEARETRESVFFAAFTDTTRARELAEALAELKGLP
ncbi:MAG: GNAT family N-acetyltransferase [Armatimonadota bacterium]